MEKQDGRFVAMVTKDFQTLNLKFDQVMFNSLVLTWETNFEVTLISYLFSYYFLCHSTALLSRMFIFLQLLNKLIALKFLTRQILQPAPFLRNLVASPVRHAGGPLALHS